MPVLALDFDVSVDEEIKKKYDSDKLKYEVPAVPNVSTQNKNSTSTSAVPKSGVTFEQEVPQITPVVQAAAKKIPSGTKFQVKSNLAISDSQKAGNVVSFTSTTSVVKNNITIPAGTKFYGVIAQSHKSQITGNGGLVVIKITGMAYGGNTFSVEGKITKANSKKIFFNNIKGNRQYLKSVAKQIDKGENFYKKSRRVSGKLADNPIGLIVASVPTIVGLAGYTVNTAISPFSAICSKGASLKIPSGSTFEIKLIKNAYVN